METKNDKIDSSNKRKKAEEILKELSEKYEKEGTDFDSIEKFLHSRVRKELKVRARIPVTISPEVKKSLREKKTPEEKAKVSVIVDFKEPKSRKGRIRISEQERKYKKRIVTLRAPEVPSSISSPTTISMEPNKDILIEKLKRRRRIKKRRKTRK